MDDFDKSYQLLCDKTYWEKGQCCAGCDFWKSDSGRLGGCSANGLFSGDDVARSLGITWASIKFKAGFPYTEMDFHCGRFTDNFDWSELPKHYLRQIGALDQQGNIKEKPVAPL